MWALDYRPKTFNDLIGQEHVVKVLSTILTRSTLPAGFIFSGTRGTGKTTTARIIAAALNCKKPNPNIIGSCGQCDPCKSVELSNCTFVHEIDAASNNSVDSIRELKTRALYHHEGNYRVFILDECHSLTNQAFEALLKQLEEPPPQTLFVLATTDPDAVPDTVMSRLMQFDFKRLTVDLIALRLQQIASIEKISIQDSRIFQAIAQKSNGAMRDAIMSLEQLSSYKEGLTVQDFYEYYGLVDGSVYGVLMDCARNANVLDARKIIENNFSRGVDIGYFMDHFMRSIGGDVVNRRLSDAQAVEIYRGCVEVKSKLKYMSSDVAMSYLFMLLLRVFHQDRVGTAKAAPATIDDLKALLS